MSRYQVIHFSPTAKQGLMHQAFLLGYIRSTQNKNGHGLSSYINAIAMCELQDTRPDDVKLQHEAIIAAGLVPKWSCEEYRPQNRLRLTPQAQLRLYKYGLDHGIMNPYKIREVTPLVSILGYMLEAIGIEWLTPINPPRKASSHANLANSVPRTR